MFKIIITKIPHYVARSRLPFPGGGTRWRVSSKIIFPQYLGILRSEFDDILLAMSCCWKGDCSSSSPCTPLLAHDSEGDE